MKQRDAGNSWRKMLSVLLSAAMVVGSVPATALAEEGTAALQEAAANETSEIGVEDENATADLDDAALTESAVVEEVDPEASVEDAMNEGQSVEILSESVEDATLSLQGTEELSIAQQTEPSTSAKTTTQLANRVNLSGSAYVTGKGWSKEPAASYIKLVGTGKGHLIEALSLKRAKKGPAGSIVYCVRLNNDGWTKEGKDGATVGAVGKNQYVEAIKIRLTGKLEKSYNVWYRVNVAGSGWLDWTRNGKAAGTAGLKKSVRAIKVAIVKKGLPHPTGTSRYKVAFAKGKGIYNIGLKKVSGDVELDKMLVEFVKRYKIRSGKKGLWKAHDVIGRYGYAFEDINPQENWKTWSIPMAKQMYRRGFGNCYRYAALMTWVARYLGYDAITVPGYHYNGSHHLVSHGWCEVRKNGKKYVIDPIFHGQHPEKNFFMVPYSKTPLVYYKHRV